MTRKNRLARLAVPMFACGIAVCCTVAYGHEYSALIKARKYTEAERAAGNKLALSPHDPDALQARVELRLIGGKDADMSEGLKFAEQCVAANPVNSGCHESLGIVLGAIAQRGSALTGMRSAGKIRDALATAVELDPGNYRATFYLLRFYLEAPAMLGGSMAKAGELVARTGRTNAAAGVLLQASLDAHRGHHDQAAAVALAANPGDSDALAAQQKTLLMNIGNALVGQKKYAQAHKLFSDTAQKYPDFPGGYFGIGKVLQESGKQADAIAYLDKSIRLDASASAFYRVAKAWQAQGDKAKAISFYEKALGFTPGLNKASKTDAENQLKALR